MELRSALAAQASAIARGCRRAMPDSVHRRIYTSGPLSLHVKKSLTGPKSGDSAAAGVRAFNPLPGTV